MSTAVGQEGNDFPSTLDTGGYKSLFLDASNETDFRPPLVDQILVTQTLPFVNNPNNSLKKIPEENYPAIKEVLKKSCIIIVGNTDFVQGPRDQASFFFSPPGDLDNSDLDPDGESDRGYFMPDPDGSTSELADLLSQRVVKEGAMVIFHIGFADEFNYFDLTLPNGTDISNCGFEQEEDIAWMTNYQTQKTQRMLDKLFNDAGISSGGIQLSFGHDSVTYASMKNSGTGNAHDGKPFTLNEALAAAGSPCNSDNDFCIDCCEDPQTDEHDCFRYYLDCPHCGPRGVFGKTRIGIHGYNVLGVENTWLHKEDDPDYDEENPMLWQKGLSGKLSGGHSFTSSNEQFARIVQCGKGSVLVTTDPKGLVGRLNGDFLDKNVTWSCNEPSQYTAGCSSNFPNHDNGADINGDLYPYEKNQFVIAKIIQKVVGQQVPEIAP